MAADACPGINRLRPIARVARQTISWGVLNF